MNWEVGSGAHLPCTLGTKVKSLLQKRAIISLCNGM